MARRNKSTCECKCECKERRLSYRIREDMRRYRRNSRVIPLDFSRSTDDDKTKKPSVNISKNDLIAIIGFTLLVLIVVGLAASLVKYGEPKAQKVMEDAFEYGKKIDANYMLNHIDRNKHIFQNVTIECLENQINAAMINTRPPLRTCILAADNVLHITFSDASNTNDFNLHDIAVRACSKK